MSEELKPCPFCGSEIEFIPSHVEEQNFVNSASIICRKCRKEYVGATFIVPGEIESEELTNNILINWWNSRPAEEAKDKVIARLEKKLSNIKDILTEYRDVSLIKINAKEAESTHFFAFKFCNNLLEDINDTDNNVGSMK